jgi:hypothetical protein
MMSGWSWLAAVSDKTSGPTSNEKSINNEARLILKIVFLLVYKVSIDEPGRGHTNTSEIQKTKLC